MSININEIKIIYAINLLTHKHKFYKKVKF